MLKGIDVSDNQGVINWSKVKNAGVQFAILRSVRRSGAADKQLANNIKGCLENGIPFDFYKYAYATTEADSEREAREVVNELKKLGIVPSKDIIIWHDVEDNIQTALSTSKLTRICISFKKVIENAGYTYGLYMGKYDFEKGEVDVSQLGDIKVWIARYYDGYTLKSFSEKPNEKYKPNVKNLWGWQYTSSGRVDGIVGNVDLNIAYYNVGSVQNQKKESEFKMPTIQKGSKGKAVKVWQIIVGVEADGIFGAKTKTATIEFQRKYKLAQDGIVGKNTWAVGLETL